MRKYTLLLLLLLVLPLRAQETSDRHITQTRSILPCPMLLTSGSGSYLFTSRTTFAVENAEQANLVRSFSSLFTRSAGFTPKLVVNKKGDIRFITDASLKSEAYQLQVTPKSITVKAADVKGFFYALQSMRLLLPAAIEKNTVTKDIEWNIPSVQVTDEPRFGYRGLMLDVARFFLPKENVLRIIDCMAMLKINTLHFHLVDDNGWRLEIKKYPRLTEVGAWRVDRTDVPFHSRRNPQAGEPTPIGGFYTQEDIKEIVAYATQRQVEVIPEIEMPAHTNSSLAAYPQLACPVVDHFIGVLPGLGGKNANAIYCAGNDSVFTFLQDVIDEVVTLFPSRYIHLGGDEAQKTTWEKCPLCQARIQKEKLPNEEELQGYFMKRVAKYVADKGKEVMGWDELTNSSMPEDAIIFGWQGMGTAALKGAKLGHRFVMTPARIMYLIRYQGPQWFEPLTYFGNNTLKDVYDYEPIQKDWKPEYASLLMGVQASLWTEFCNKPEDVDYLLFPRLAALAEGAWTLPEKKNWTRFIQSVDNYNAHLAEKGIVYARSMYNIQHTVTPQSGGLNVDLECIRPDVEIRYTLDGSEPTAASALYKQALIIRSALTMKSATFIAGKQMGQTLVLPIGWNKATAKTILGGRANEKVLTNGVRGSLKQTDFEWCNWEKSDSISFTIDLEKSEKLHTFAIGCITNYGMAIHKPSAIRVELSNDNTDFNTVGELKFTFEEIFREGTFIDNCTIDLGGKEARYVRVTAKGAGKCPENHVRPGQESRVFFDEIMID
ncbi:family 20 glycosylhydrolase [Bacteroides sp.]|uniref:glycoside hydrolase family 20 protein n=1 Tax=Bacteroides sp. TaxID=29523 RepID=UPI002FCC9436